MRLALKQYFSITRLTALEASRQPIYLLLSTASLLFIALLPVLVTHVIGDSSRIVRDSSLAVLFVSGLILGCYAATATITHELKKGTLGSIISKPVNRVVFFLAKFSGVALVMMIYTAITTMATMLSVRTAAVTYYYDWWGIGPLLVAITASYIWGASLNYRNKVPFVSRAFWILVISVTAAFIFSSFIPTGSLAGGHGHHHGHEASIHTIDSALHWNIVPAGILIGIAVILLCSIAVTLSLKFELVPTLSIAFGIFILGLMSDYLFGQRIDDNWIYSFIYGLLPNWQHFWTVDAIGRNGIPWSYTIQAAGYAGIYITVVLSAGIAVFYKMEVK